MRPRFLYLLLDFFTLHFVIQNSKFCTLTDFHCFSRGRFTSLKDEQPLKDMALQEKKNKYRKHIGALTKRVKILKAPINLRLQDISMMTQKHFASKKFHSLAVRITFTTGIPITSRNSSRTSRRPMRIRKWNQFSHVNTFQPRKRKDLNWLYFKEKQQCRNSSSTYLLLQLI